MKKLLFAAVAGLLTMGVLQAGCGWRNRRNCCPTRRRTCAPRRVSCEPTPPRCCKTIQVPKTIMVDKVIEVPARKIVIPQPDVVEHICQDPICIKIPVTTYRYEYKPVPDKVVHHKQPDVIRYECPADCD